ncbi:sigma-70 family RNA polymerase sigma factor [Olivibacter domesticus]|uniref:RNA polymerase sigma-70 factor, ECF subfamily n=1 Tax=Olivibacter domesticus TaxID=407022 RepID=A0A1H7IGJ9_OLID1|nr:sigma-70 family RNA polymerase sigma factor [Olivibacter domesticus]SEK61444.1 RNA polymerase sigma-70 factor, ECF subfamily [Olivibacter domesticus]
MSHNKVDQELFNALKSGDLEAVSAIYNKSRGWLKGLAVSILGREADEEAKDLVQDFFVDFWEKRLFLRIEHAEALDSYLYRAFYNRCLNKLKSKERLQKREHEYLLWPEAYQLPANRLENNELNLALNAAMDKVPPMSAKVFKLVYFEEKSRLEVASEMGISPNTVKNQLGKAVKIFRGYLKNFY